VSHANAALTPKHRLKLARLVVDDGWTVARAAEFYNVSWPTAKRWRDRYLEMGAAGMADRSSRPHVMPTRTPAPVVRKIVHLRWKQRLGPVEIAEKLAMPASTVHAVLLRCHINRLWHVDRVTGEKIRRYEHDRPGALIHVDVKKVPNIPDGGGHRFVGRQQGNHNRFKHKSRNPRNAGTSFLHTVIDDHSRVAYVEVHRDERKATACGVLCRAVAWFAARGVRVERVLSDNGSCYRSKDWHTTCAALGIKVKKTRPYRPQTNGKLERFHRTLDAGWTYKRFYSTNSARLKALPGWVHHYNHHRFHTAIGKVPPITRLTNLPGQYS
jgi:transposase InsO family protein